MRSTASTTASSRRDEGFTLTELMMAMAIFAVVMAIIGGAMLGGFSTIRSIITGVDTQATVQNASDWTGRLVRYMDIPEGGTAAIEEASGTALTFYSYSGEGHRSEAPYKVRLWSTTNASGTQTLHSLVVEPTRTDTGWTWPAFTAANGKQRDLLTVPKGSAAPMRLAMDVCNALTTCATTIRTVSLPVSGMPTLSAGEVPYRVTLTIGDSKQPAKQVVQQIRLVNLP